MNELFARFARATSRAAGRPVAFALAVLMVLGWAMLGPVFGFSSTWQLVINTTTTIVTFLMVFLMQSTQNRDTEALQLKIDELIRAVADADDSVMALDEAEEEELKAARQRYTALANGTKEGGGAKAANGTKAAGGEAKGDGTGVKPVRVKPRKSRRRGARGPRQ